MNLQDIINSRYALKFGLAFARLVPPKFGYSLADFVADRISARSHVEMVQAVRINQWVVSGGGLTRDELDRAVQETYRNTARSLFDVYHNLRNEEAITAKIDFTPDFEELLERNLRQSEGTVVVVPHMSNFDFVAMGVAVRGVRALGLGFPQPTGGYELQNKLRSDFGLVSLPTSLSSLKKATAWLQDGGTIMTGLDRPVPGGKYKLRFFGREASLPVHHVLLALKAKVPVIVAAAILKPDGRYSFEVSPLTAMKPHTNRHEELTHNATCLLRYAEEYIRKAPRQWAMYYPVWPDAVEELPKLREN